MEEKSQDAMGVVAKHIAGVAFEDLPSEAVHAAKKAIIDTIGVVIAGSSQEGSKLITEYVSGEHGRKESTVAVFGAKVPAYFAAQANGAMARALEIDDVHDIFPLHVSASLVPACLAISERRGRISGKEFITAVALGQDLTIRFAKANKVSPLNTGRDQLYRVFPLAGVSAKLLGLSEDKIWNAMGIVFASTVGEGQSIQDGAMTAYIAQGTAAKAGVEAALMSANGIIGPRNILQGRAGYYKAIEPDNDIAALTADIGIVFQGTETCTKLHSVCRSTAEAVDVALEMIKKDGVEPKKIKTVTVKVNQETYNFVCSPLERKHAPQTHTDAKFSIPFVVAAAMLKGKVFIEQVSEDAIKDPDILALTRKVIPVVDKECESTTMPCLGSTILEVEMEDGRKISRKTDYPRGNWNNPASMDDVFDKFRNCFQFSAIQFPETQINELVEVLQHLEKVKDVRQIAELLVPIK